METEQTKSYIVFDKIYGYLGVEEIKTSEIKTKYNDFILKLKEVM
jgi:hypothetical protein